MALKDRFDDVNYGLKVRDIRDAMVESFYDRRVLIVYPMDDLFPSQGYTYSQLSAYMETKADLWSLEHRHGVDVFYTSENTDFSGLQSKINKAKEKASAIIVFTDDPMDTVFLGPKDHVVYFGPDELLSDIRKTRNVHNVRNFQEACDVMAWIRYDLEGARELIRPQDTVKSIDWGQYEGEVPHMLN